MSERQPVIALVSARAARSLDEDLPPLEQALRDAGAQVHVAEWDDPSVEWQAFDVAVLRSTWDYTTRLDEFRAWIRSVSERTRLINPADVVRWNTDKHYLQDLAEAGAPIIPAVFVEPGQDADAGVARALAVAKTDEIVVKPAVGAGSKDAQRHGRTQVQAMCAHVQRLIDAGRSAMLQPYLASVDERGETALLFYSGTFSHAIRKGPMLRSGVEQEPGLFVQENITPRVPTDAELRVAERVLAAVPFGKLVYARIDLLMNDDGSPALLELELTEPSMFFAHAPGSPERFARVLMDVHLAVVHR
jgi:O-ureido-D-serine cyclo-ligase